MGDDTVPGYDARLGALRSQLTERHLRHTYNLDDREQDRADRELENRTKLARRGQDYALIALVVVSGVVLTLALTGHDWVAGTFGGTYAVALVGLFLTNRYPKFLGGAGSSEAVKDGSERARAESPASATG